jgi:putative heme iron utilization protein
MHILRQKVCILVAYHPIQIFGRLILLLHRPTAQAHCLPKLASFPKTRPTSYSTTRIMAQKEEQNKGTGHSVPQTSVVADGAQDPEILAYQTHQASVPRLSLAEEARTLVNNGKFGVISTISSKEPTGFPSGSVGEFTADAAGRPIFSFSSLSPHTGDVLADERCSLTVMADGFRGLSDARVNITGKMSKIIDSEILAAKELYLSKHPQSFWVEFGDFTWFRMEEVLSARLVGGFARAGKVSGEEYSAATVDPVAAFSGPVCGHMNADHAESTQAMIKHYIGITVDKATMLSLDRLGVNVACERQGESFKCRLPFPRPAEDRKMIKELIVEMTRAAAGAGAGAQS